MTEDKRFTAVIALMEGADEGEKPYALYHFIHSAYADEEKEVDLGEANAEERKDYWEDHIWKGFYAYAYSNEMLDDLEIFIKEDGVGPSDILLILGRASDFKHHVVRMEFVSKLKKYIGLGLNVLVITDGFESIDDEDTVELFMLSEEDILSSFRKDRQGWPAAVKRFRTFVDGNFM